MKYKAKKLKDFPEHCKESCYAITDNGHTMLPDDVVNRLNDADKILNEFVGDLNENIVQQRFECNGLNPKNCVYGRGISLCQYSNGVECCSKVALVNRMVLKLKEMGFIAHLESIEVD